MTSSTNSPNGRSGTARHTPCRLLSARAAREGMIGARREGAAGRRRPAKSGTSAPRPLAPLAAIDFSCEGRQLELSIFPLRFLSDLRVDRHKSRLRANRSETSYSSLLFHRGGRRINNNRIHRLRHLAVRLYGFHSRLCGCAGKPLQRGAESSLRRLIQVAGAWVHRTCGNGAHAQQQDCPTSSHRYSTAPSTDWSSSLEVAVRRGRRGPLRMPDELRASRSYLVIASGGGARHLRRRLRGGTALPR